MYVYFRLDWLFTEILIETARIEKWKREIASIAHRSLLFVFFSFFGFHGFFITIEKWYPWLINQDKEKESSK